MLDTVVMTGDDVCCSVVFGTLVGVFVFSVMWSELLMTSAISCPLWPSVYECQRVECAFTSEVMYFSCFGFRGELGFLNCDDVCMCVVNKQFELLEFVSESIYVDLQYDEISLTFTAEPVCLCGVSSPVVVLGLFVRLS